MAEQVNKRIEDMINELEQMQRLELYTPEEIRELSRKRKEFEYKIQRQTKQKEDYVNYIAYELALLEDISLRRKQTKQVEKKQTIEYVIAKRLNRIFKQFIYRFQDDVEVYFQYIKFCQSVGFKQAVSAIIGQMLQVYGDKPKMWQMAAKWEYEEQNNLENARNFLLKGIHRHPEADMLYLDLFKLELMMAFNAADNDAKVKQLKRASVVWKSGLKNISDVNYLFKVCDLSMKYDLADDITNDIKEEIWLQRHIKDVWSYIATMELRGCHWKQIADIIDENSRLPEKLKNYISVYEEALLKFPDEIMCTKYIHELLGINEDICTDIQKINAVKRAWMFGLDLGVLTGDMFSFGLEMLKIDNQTTTDEMIEIINNAINKNPSAAHLWREKLLMNKPDDKKMYAIVQEASKVLKNDELINLCNVLLDNISSGEVVKSLHKKFQNCESTVFLAIKPKLLRKTYEHSGLKAARVLYDEFIRTPPIQLDIHTTMIDIEKSQSVTSYKQLKKCYECMVQHLGAVNYEIWLDYIQFETENGNAKDVPNVYRRALAMLAKDLVDEFIKVHTLSKLK